MIRANHGTFGGSRIRGWQIGNSQYFGQNLPGVSVSTTYPFFSEDGTQMFFIFTSGGQWIRYYTLSTPWDISTAVLSPDEFILVSNTYDGLFIDKSGTRLYVVTIDDEVIQYSMSPWDITTLVLVNSDVSTLPDTILRGIFFKEDGTKMFIGDDTNQSILQYNLSTPWDITTLTANGVSPAVAGSSQTGLYFQPDGRKAFINEWSSTAGFNGVRQLVLSTPWDVTTAVSELFFVADGTTGTLTTHSTMASSGIHMYIFGRNNETIYNFRIKGGSSP